MGQQQLLLIVLGVIIVGIAIAVGINMFVSASEDANRDAVTSDLSHLASKAQQYYRKPTTMGGGNGDFNNFQLNRRDMLNGNGLYGVADSDPGTTPNKAYTDGAADLVITDVDSIFNPGAGATEMWFIAYGKEQGRDGINHVQAVTNVDGTTVTTTVVN